MWRSFKSTISVFLRLNDEKFASDSLKPFSNDKLTVGHFPLLVIFYEKTLLWKYKIVGFRGKIWKIICVTIYQIFELRCLQRYQCIVFRYETGQTRGTLLHISLCPTPSQSQVLVSFASSLASRFSFLCLFMLLRRRSGHRHHCLPWLAASAA